MIGFNKLIRKVKKFIKVILKKFNFGAVSYSNLIRLQNFEHQIDQNLNSKISLEFIKTLPNKHTNLLVPLLNESHSDLHQDLFALSESNFKRNGFFVEFGAASGLSGSNTYLLEKEFSWKGILAEPARDRHRELHKNRPNAFVEEKCVYKTSGSLMEFSEIPETGISTLTKFIESDEHAVLRKNSNKYMVETISLNDLLLKYNAPTYIDYLSIDTEGSEFEILSSFDFSKYEIKVITCEHNNTHNRGKIYTLLVEYGYKRKYENCSHYDDWFVKT